MAYIAIEETEPEVPDGSNNVRVYTILEHRCDYLLPYTKTVLDELYLQHHATYDAKHDRHVLRAWDSHVFEQSLNANNIRCVRLQPWKYKP